MSTTFANEVQEPLHRCAASLGAVTEAELAHVPETARRYLRFLRVPWRARDRSFRLSGRGRFRRTPTGPWMTFHVRQSNTAHPIMRLFHMRLDMAPLVWVMVRDSYLGGRGRMRGRLLDRFTVVDATGPELDLGELVTWLNDATLFSPSMLLDPAVTWSAVDDASFDIAVTDAGRTVKARVRVDERGALRDFATTDRFVQDPDTEGHPWIRARWTTPIDGWDLRTHRPRPTGGRAIWHLATGPFPYAELDMPSIRVVYNAPPYD